MMNSYYWIMKYSNTLESLEFVVIVDNPHQQIDILNNNKNFKEFFYWNWKLMHPLNNIHTNK